MNEPTEIYGNDKKPKLKFFNSFEEMNEADARESAMLTPLQRLRNITEMIKRTYAKEMSHEMSDLTIKFK